MSLLPRWLATAALTLAATLASAAPLAVLYKKDAASSAERIDTAVQAALLGAEEKFIDLGYEVVQPEQKMYDVLDRAGAAVVVTFATDAGWSLVLSMEKQVRPYPNTDMQFAEARLRAKVYSGRRILASVAENGQIGFRPGNEDKAFEAAARKAAGLLVARIDERLKNAPAPAEVAPTPGPAATPAAPTPSDPVAAGRNKWALLFGVADFSNVARLSNLPVPPLPGVKNDMVAMEKLLDDMNVARERRIVLFDQKATTAALRKALQEIGAKAAADDVVMVYFSSHGLPKQEGISGLGYPVTWDTKVGDKQSIIDFEEIRSTLAAMPASQIVWLADTCHSGGAAIGIPSVEFSNRNIVVKQTHGLAPAQAANIGGGKDMAVITSSREDQPSIDDRRSGHGLFSFHLIQGLKDGRGKVPMYRLFKDIIEPGVTGGARSLNTVQQPGFAKTGRGDMLLF